MDRQTKHSVCFSSFRFLLAARGAGQLSSSSSIIERDSSISEAVIHPSIQLASHPSSHPSIHLLGQLTKRLAHTHGHPSISSSSVRPSSQPLNHSSILSTSHPMEQTSSYQLPLLWQAPKLPVSLLSCPNPCPCPWFQYPYSLLLCLWTGLNAFVRSLFSLTLIEFCEFCFSCLCQFSFYTFLYILTHWAQKGILTWWLLEAETKSWQWNLVLATHLG